MILECKDTKRCPVSRCITLSLFSSLFFPPFFSLSSFIFSYSFDLFLLLVCNNELLEQFTPSFVFVL